MCFYFLKRNYGLEPTTMREIFFEKASAQRKDSEVSAVRTSLLYFRTQREPVAPETGCHRPSCRKCTSIHRKW